MAHIMQLLVAVILLLLTPACGPSVWERSFTQEPGLGSTTPTAIAIVRKAPWGRIGPALEAEARRIIESDTHREDWTLKRARDSELELLGALQLPIEAEHTQLLGRSHFKTTRRIDPNTGELADFAVRIGADYAIWSSQPLGKAETIEREALTRDRWRWERIWDADNDRFLYVQRWDPETVWVPVVVERDEVRWVVFYVRRMR